MRNRMYSNPHTHTLIVCQDVQPRRCAGCETSQDAVCVCDMADTRHGNTAVVPDETPWRHGVLQ